MKNKNEIIKKISQIIGWTTIVISVVLAVLFYVNIKDAKALDFDINLLMDWTLIMILLALLVAFIIGPIVSIISNPKSLVKGLISIGVLVIIFVIGYAMSGSDTSAIHLNYTVPNLQTKLTFTDTGLFSLYIMFGLAVLAVIVAETKNIFKL